MDLKEIISQLEQTVQQNNETLDKYSIGKKNNDELFKAYWIANVKIEALLISLKALP